MVAMKWLEQSLLRGAWISPLLWLLFTQNAGGFQQIYPFNTKSLSLSFSLQEHSSFSLLLLRSSDKCFRDKRIASSQILKDAVNPLVENDKNTERILTDEEKLEAWLRSTATPRNKSSKAKPLISKGQSTVSTKKINVVLTHITADFDSLASAVGLAKLWSIEDPETKSYVVMPRGSHPIVQTFLALHRNLFPIISLKDVDEKNVQRVGLVDAQRADRIKPALHLVKAASEVHVYDHHVGKDCDLNATHLVVQKVGSVSTLMTQLLRNSSAELSDAESTLLALGIHSDTGSLTFDSCTPEDAGALAWLMEQGASQQAIAEFLHTALSPEQEKIFAEAFQNLKRTQHHGATVATILIGCTGYINGLARVAQNVLELTNCDVLLMGAVYSQKVGKDANNMIVIGRARPRQHSVDLHSLFDAYGGGGHPKAAALSLRLNDPLLEGKDPAEFMDHLVQVICQTQLKPEISAREFMTAPVLTTLTNETIAKVDQTLAMNDIHSLPVVDDDSIIQGLISRNEVGRALRQGYGSRPVKGYMKTETYKVDVSATLQEVTRVFVKGESTQVLVTDQGKLAGMITRTDLLREYHFYSSIHYYNKAFSMRLDDDHRKFIMSLRKRLKKYDKEDE
mmetsp:Transcript_5093/g.7034  ORF Transcript_5093/g.7034 Transcript_5093/m.7034 type:complete len:623 (-) Transcript_5093:202-2070(-)|eukprot:CAMPEP_0117761306 /NCGR_PEP_ID=MMETSP0947-20121206/17204_1 /TAXON_ID=44440 /ORGANISM="Chattonella subsalsa, Strain CCMP2191" /LENGTH=622 /DNA_ID=CAMNT_0005582277 /DNA_START=124 /DNA_END=1992 /DNA_ORIENTATION=+